MQFSCISSDSSTYWFLLSSANRWLILVYWFCWQLLQVSLLRWRHESCVWCITLFPWSLLHKVPIWQHFCEMWWVWLNEADSFLEIFSSSWSEAPLFPTQLIWKLCRLWRTTGSLFGGRGEDTSLDTLKWFWAFTLLNLYSISHLA